MSLLTHRLISLSLSLSLFLPRFVSYDDIDLAVVKDDLWTQYHPPRIALRGLSSHLRRRLLLARGRKEGAVARSGISGGSGGSGSGGGARRSAVLYIRRKGVRSIESKLEERLLADIRTALQRAPGGPGGGLRVFDPAGLSMAEQAELFAGAEVIVGPHGAGLTNMIFADPDRCQVVELPMRPHVNRCFGYMAQALGLGYWVVPEFRSYYHTTYKGLPARAVKAVVETALAALAVARGGEAPLGVGLEEEGGGEEGAPS